MPRIPTHKILIIPLFLTLVTSRVVQGQVFVNSGATSGANNGTSWSDAYIELSSAIANANSAQQIWVAQGMYKPGTISTDTFLLKPLVEIYGGFAGNETLLSERNSNPATNNTVLSGDLGGGTHSTNLITGSTLSLNDTARLDGFTLTGVSGVTASAILCGDGFDPSSPTLANLRVVDSSSSADGAGLAIFAGSEPQVFDCRFENNTTLSYGGAVLVDDDAGPRFVRCEFILNSAGAGGGAVGCFGSDDGTRFEHCQFESNSTSEGLGGAVFLNSCEKVTFRDCMFEGNETESSDGGGIYASSSGFEVVRCGFTLNKALGIGSGSSGGGAISTHGSHFLSDPVRIINSTFFNNSSERGVGGAVWLLKNDLAELTNCLFVENETVNGGLGGGLAFQGVLDIDITNCTFSKNHSDGTAGGIHAILEDSSVQIGNTILWDNTDSGSDVTAAQITSSGSGAFSVQYSDIEDGTPGGSVYPGTGNIDTDPDFVNTAGNDYKLRPGSGCVDAGSDGAVPADSGDVDNDSNMGEKTPLDLDLVSRFDYCRVDMGAYETTCPVCEELGDMNGDSVRNGADIQPFVNCLLTPLVDQTCDCRCGDYVAYIDAETSVSYHGVGLEDVPQFVACLIDKSEHCSERICEDPEEAPRSGLEDCQPNGINDEVDVFLETSSDCNGNGIPDECDIAECDSDWTCGDVNENGIPDGCEEDCNGNEVPDSWDILLETSEDCNSNDVPDECDLDCNENDIPDDCEELESDCNSNGIPDECEYDCDENGVPDDCDLDPLDPDGDEWVDPDCNENGWPDSCDIDEGPPFGSLDVNENEIPDECEEEESLMGGGESMMSGGSSCDASYWPADYSVLSNEMYAAWEEFMLWCMQERWGPDSEFSGAEQLERLIEKKYEVGICGDELNEQ